LRILLPVNPIWQPSSEQIERATLTRYQRSLGFDSYQELWQWSVDELEAFWQSVVDFFEVQFVEPPTAVLGSRDMPGAQWFPGATLSYAEHVFWGKDADAIAIRHASELRPLGEWTWGRLRCETAAIAAGLRKLGVGRGDRVAAYMPNIPETVAAFLACASLGAIWY
jgi:acetoacetyl-CoA synthetase